MNRSLVSLRQPLALALLLLGSALVQAEPAGDDAPALPQQETREQAAEAHREAVDDAVVRISAATRLELDVDLPTRAQAPVSGD